MASIGRAAALVEESTYQSILDINDKCATNISIAKVRIRLDGVNNIFLNEVFMLFYYNLYSISAQLEKPFNELNKPFSGLNMFFLVIFLATYCEWRRVLLSIAVALASRFIQD